MVDVVVLYCRDYNIFLTKKNRLKRTGKTRCYFSNVKHTQHLQLIEVEAEEHLIPILTPLSLFPRGEGSFTNASTDRSASSPLRGEAWYEWV